MSSMLEAFGKGDAKVVAGVACSAFDEGGVLGVSCSGSGSGSGSAIDATCAVSHEVCKLIVMNEFIQHRGGGGG
jgi:hypothetical protein